MTKETAMKILKELHDNSLFSNRIALETLIPELAESEDERVRKALIELVKQSSEILCKSNQDGMLTWLEKQDKVDTASYEVAENEKREFVGYGFLKCKGDFLSFKEGENYWLEYVGKDNYNVRSDNLLGQTFHITPQQLYTVFRPTTWLEKQGQTFTKKDVDDAYLKGVFDTKQGEWDARYKYVEEIIAADDIYQMAMNDAMVNEAKEKAAKALSKLCIGKLLGFENQGEQKTADKAEPFDKYEGLTDFERTLADICIGWIGEELGWKQYIKDNADVLLKIAIKMFNSIQDAPFEQKPVGKPTLKFKVGDMVCKKKDNSFCATINSITDTVYLCDVFDSDGDYDDDYAFLISEQDEYELVEKIKPQSAWSDEDEEQLQNCTGVIWAADSCLYEDKQEMEAWLKRLKDRIEG